MRCNYPVKSLYSPGAALLFVSSVTNTLCAVVFVATTQTGPFLDPENILGLEEPEFFTLFYLNDFKVHQELQKLTLKVHSARLRGCSLRYLPSRLCQQGT